MKYLKFRDKFEALGFAHEQALRDGIDPKVKLKPDGFGVQPDGTLSLPDAAADRLPQRAKTALADTPEAARGKPVARPAVPTKGRKP